MSVPQVPPSWSSLLVGRWQVPLALLAVAVAALTIARFSPSPRSIDVRTAIDEVDLLEQSGDLEAAAQGLERLLDSPGHDLPQDIQAAFRERLADLVYRSESRQSKPRPEAARQVLAHEELATALGRPASPARALRRAYAHLWLAEHEAALAGFLELLTADAPPASRRQAATQIVGVLRDAPALLPRRSACAERLLADPDLAPELTWWALRAWVRDALDRADPGLARRRFDAHAERLALARLRGYGDYLDGLVSLAEDRPAQAEAIARWVDDWVRANGTDAALNRFGHLELLNRCLAGRAALAQRRADEALAELDVVLAASSDPELNIDAAVARFAALVALDRLDEALDALRQQLTRAEAGASAWLPVLRSAARRESLTQFRALRAAGRAANAVLVGALTVELAVDEPPDTRRALLDALGQAGREAADAATEPTDARAHRAAAAAAFEQAADLAARRPAELPDLLFAAADQFDQAGRLEDASRLFARFVTNRDDDPRAPVALLRLAQASDALGRPAEALHWYRRLIDGYPALNEAAAARVQAAKSLISLGADRYAEAEQLLSDLLAGGSVAPSAAGYRDALLTLGELLYAAGRYGDAVARLEDFQTLYPADPERFTALLLKAGALRRSAELLRAAPPDAVAPAAVAESRRRLQAAADLYGEIYQVLATGGGGDETTAAQAALALLYRADCLFELNDPDALDQALDLYQSAARIEGRTESLTALVQVANIQLRRGDTSEAARTLERARWQLKSIPDQAFADTRSGDRAAWSTFLDVALSANLFRDPATAGPAAPTGATYDGQPSPN